MKFYGKYRDWDCYSDSYSDIITYWIGIMWNSGFIGIEWRKEIPYTGEN